MKQYTLHLYSDILEISRIVSGDLEDPWTRDDLHRWLDEMIDKMAWKGLTADDIAAAGDPTQY